MELACLVQVSLEKGFAAAPPNPEFKVTVQIPMQACGDKTFWKPLGDHSKYFPRF